MIELIKKILKRNNIKAYNIFDETRESVELFFIKRQLDLTRNVNVREIRVRVYRDSEGIRGMSDVYIYPGMDESEIEETIVSGYDAAKYTRNPHFELMPGNKADIVLPARNLRKEAVKTAEALYKAEDIVKDAFINSAEIFSNKKTVHIVDSNNADIRYEKYFVSGEFVTQCKNELNDVEQYQDFEYEDVDSDIITDKCVKSLLMVKDRAVAQKTDIDYSEYPIIITDSYVGDLLSFYLDRANAAYIYPKYSSYKKGYKTSGKVSINTVPRVPYSEDGIRLSKLPLIRDGVVENIHGPMRFLSYLDLAQSGVYDAFECENADMPFEQMCTGKYIIVKNFSDFQIDALDGHFGGEFRLAYLCDGNERKIITGGTVSGNLLESESKITYSVEKYRDAKYYGPMAVKIG